LNGLKTPAAEWQVYRCCFRLLEFSIPAADFTFGKRAAALHDPSGQRPAAKGRSK